MDKQIRVLMTTNIVAGVFVMLGVLLSQLHHPYWIYFAGFVGFMLFQSGLTNFCPMWLILGKILKS